MRSPSRRELNLAIDLALGILLALSFLSGWFASIENLTEFGLHKYTSIAFVGIAVFHVALHWHDLIAHLHAHARGPSLWFRAPARIVRPALHALKEGSMPLIPPIVPVVAKVIPPPLRKPIPLLIIVFLIGAAAIGVSSSGFGTVSQTASSSCGLAGAVFCDTFDAPAGNGNRSGDLNGTIWGVSRATGWVNFGQNFANTWSPTDVDACGTIRPAQPPPHDVIICNGQVREAVNDNGSVTDLAMYPKQPFDFAGRTGKIVFDVSNDTLNTHDAWPEIWVTDKPDPTPFNHFDSWQALPQDGFGVRMGSGAPPNNIGYCQNNNNIDKLRWTVDSAVVVRNHVMDDTNGYGPRQVQVHQLDCVVSPTGPNGGLNHVEIDVSQNQIDVYATDAGTTAPLHHIASITSANLTLSRGLVWFEDAHYNAIKATGHEPEDGPHRTHTFAWDNIAFDGPFTFHDLAYDAPDAMTANTDGTLSLGRFAQGGQATSWNVAGLPAGPSAAAARVLFNFWDQTNPATLDITVNGHPHSLPWPYPDGLTFTWRTIDVTVPLTDLVAGTNVVTIGSSQPMVISNVDIVLSNVGGAPAPTVAPAATGTPVPTVIPSTAVPTGVPATSVPATVAPTAGTSTCTQVMTLNGTPTIYTRPVTECADR